MPTQHLCSECGVELTAEAQGGLCVQCLFRLGLKARANAVAPVALVTEKPGDRATPEVQFDRRWALTVLERVKERLRGEFIAAGKADLFDELQEFLSEKQPTPHADIAARHGMSVSEVGVAIHHLRQRYGELICEETARTVGGPEEVEDEVRHLIAALGR